MITRAIENCFRLAKERNWKRTYWAFDVHGTILRPSYKKGEISTEFYPYAMEALQLLSKEKDIVKILYTCSYPDEILEYIEYFATFDIRFDAINRNPEVIDGGYGYYQDKFYFNVLMDDKAGFDGETDWKNILDLLKRGE